MDKDSNSQRIVMLNQIEKQNEEINKLTKEKGITIY